MNCQHLAINFRAPIDKRVALCSGHNTANIQLDNYTRCDKTMPSLIRFLTISGAVVGIFYGSMYVLAKYFQPEPKEISKAVRNLQVR